MIYLKHKQSFTNNKFKMILSANALIAIDHVTISRFGQTAGNVRTGIYFSSSTTGTVSNCTYNRNITSLPFNDGFYSGYTFTSDVYNNIP